MTGFVFVDKEEGMTSFSAVARLRRVLGEKKVGHTGTLDPMATGVLVAAVGKAAKFIELLPDHDKAYDAVFLLGRTTDTLDITGKVLSVSEKRVTCGEVQSVIDSFAGTIDQVPPMYSALKMNGVKLVDLARRGVEVERKARPVEIKSIVMTGCDEERGVYSIHVDCSKGTYIRSLTDSIGAVLGTGAVLTSLRRTSANGVDVSRCRTLGAIEEAAASGAPGDILVPIPDMLGYDRVFVTEKQAVRAANGGELSLDRLPDADVTDGAYYCVFSPSGDFIALGKAVSGEGVMKMIRTAYENNLRK